MGEIIGFVLLIIFIVGFFRIDANTAATRKKLDELEKLIKSNQGRKQ